MTQMLGKFVNFLPLGIVAAVAIGRATNGPRLRRVAAGLFFAASAGLGCAIELAQVFFLPHYPDVTDVLFYTSGSVAGYFCGQYVFAGDAARGR
jgi:glycopeptide antibiotics resistance protein